MMDVQMNVWIDTDVRQAVRDYMHDKNMSQRAVVEEALTCFIGTERMDAAARKRKPGPADSTWRDKCPNCKREGMKCICEEEEP